MGRPRVESGILRGIPAYLFLRLVLGPVAVALLLAAASPFARAQERAGGTFNFFVSQTVGRIDPITTQANYLQSIANQIYDQLVRYQVGSWQVEPAIAASWDVSADGLSYVFTIRDDAFFHDGSPITVHDVAFSLERARSDTSVWHDNYLNVAAISASEKDNSVTLTLSRPDPFLLEKLASVGGSAIVPQAAVEKWGDEFGTSPETTIGSGPYRLVENSATRLVFERFEKYYEPVYADRVVQRIIPDARTERLEFEAGNIDWIGSVLDADFALRLKSDPRFEATYHEGPAPDAFWYGFNTSVAPFDDERVRHAISLAIDMDRAVQVYGMGNVATGLIHPDLPGYQERQRPGRDVEAARSLLAEAGYGGGLDIELYVWNIPGFVAMSEYVVQQLTEAGIRTQLRTVEFGTFISEVRKGTYPFFINLGNIGVPDSAQWLYDSFHSEGPFTVAYENPEVDALLSEAIVTTDIEERAALAARAEDIILGDFVAIPIMNRVAATVWQPWVRGVEDFNATAGPGYTAVRWNRLWLDPSRR